MAIGSREMIEFLDRLKSELSVFVQSDIYGPPPPMWYIAMTGQAAHFLIGSALACVKASRSVVTVIAVAWIAKELLGDIPNSGGAALVYADSLADLAFAALGYGVARQKGKPSAFGPYITRN